MKTKYLDYLITENDDYCTISRYLGREAVITIPNEVGGKPVRVIGSRAFQGLTTLQAVTLPDNIEVIDHHAFSECTNLRFIALGNGIRILGANAFEKCLCLHNLQLPSELRLIFDNAFDGCSALLQLHMSEESVIALGPNAFRGCPVYDFHKRSVSCAERDILPSVICSQSDYTSTEVTNVNPIQLGYCYAERQCSVVSFVCAGLLMVTNHTVRILEIPELDWQMKFVD